MLNQNGVRGNEVESRNNITKYVALQMTFNTKAFIINILVTVWDSGELSPVNQSESAWVFTQLSHQFLWDK